MTTRCRSCGNLAVNHTGRCAKCGEPNHAPEPRSVSFIERVGPVVVVLLALAAVAVWYLVY